MLSLLVSTYNFLIIPSVPKWLSIIITKRRTTMFCNQCEQTAKGGCSEIGVCGKKQDVAALQDLLTYAVRGLSHLAVSGRLAGINDAAVNRFFLQAIFSTLTNVNFDPIRLETLIRETVKNREILKSKITGADGNTSSDDPAATFQPAEDIASLVKQGEEVGLPIDWARNEDVKSLQEITLYGIRGAAAYADHAAILGQEDDAVYASLQEKLAQMTNKTGCRKHKPFRPSGTLPGQPGA
jgi:hydroxylamine reductase